MKPQHNDPMSGVLDMGLSCGRANPSDVFVKKCVRCSMIFESSFDSKRPTCSDCSPISKRKRKNH